MSGGCGDDLYFVDTTGDLVSEENNQGTDTVQAQINYTLTKNVEILRLEGQANQGIGNSLNNIIIGNSRNNYLAGKIVF